MTQTQQSMPCLNFLKHCHANQASKFVYSVSAEESKEPKIAVIDRAKNQLGPPSQSEGLLKDVFVDSDETFAKSAG